MILKAIEGLHSKQNNFHDVLKAILANIGSNINEDGQNQLNVQNEMLKNILDIVSSLQNKQIRGKETESNSNPPKGIDDYNQGKSIDIDHSRVNANRNRGGGWLSSYYLFRGCQTPQSLA